MQIGRTDTGHDRPRLTLSLTRVLPECLVASVVVFNLVTLHAETTSVAYLNDSTLHSEMVRFATAQIRAGHNPLTSWFPLLGEGSPQFVHYQSLGAMLTGALGVVVGPNVAFSWVLYLVLATWPISIYFAVRLLRFDRLIAAVGALISPLVVSTLGVGYEQQSYLWIGYGVWSQLLAMWTLPLAWGWSWRAMQHRRALLPATVTITATIAFHYFTGYLAILGIVVAFATSPTPFRRRCRRAAELVVAVACTSAWVIVPLIWLRPWASINEFLQRGPDVNSYGARQVMAWLFTGQLFDARRVPVLTSLVLLGMVFMFVRSRRDARARNVSLLFLLSLLLFFGRTTFGAAFRLLPGSEDLFLRRFLMGVQLAGIIAAAVGIVECGRLAQPAYERLRTYLGFTDAPGEASVTGPSITGPHVTGPHVTSRNVKGLTAAGFVALIVLLVPCFHELVTIDSAETANINFQRHADATAGATIAPIIDHVKAKGGRVYAGLPVAANQIGGWGSSLTVGEVPVYKYLTRFNIDVVGYTLRTASLMTDPEAYFNDAIPADFPLFGVRWLIYPLERKPPPGATLVMRRGSYVLWELHTSGYLEVIDTVGSITANRTNIGLQSSDFVRSNVAATRRYPTVGFNGHVAPLPTLAPSATPTGPPGRVVAEHVMLDAGTASCTVSTTRTAVVLLKASFDPGWQVTVDGKAAHTEMIAPAYVGVVVPPGRHHVVFTYANNTAETLWLILLAIALIALVVIHVRTRREVLVA